ncbi:unnamed protein product [Pseudo-nitzschia multistriata]|uniref:Cyclin N-terminal domain-containing protein n=1 Tax=Pseudo-nitzschia multistriata TaxID=183589 RepID=A0A448ZBD6_9STRA|nr:unnamed protein product [Pseudo-nitzschia multistriata]
MIRQEESYYKCPHYLSLEERSTQTLVFTPVPSVLQVVEEMASLVTDIRAEPSMNCKGDDHCASPGSSTCDLYGDLRAPLRAFLPNSRSEQFQEVLSLSSWRHRMLEWGNAVCVTFGIDASVLESAFNILDRYIAVEISHSNDAFENLSLTREDFQLFSMVSIYIAVKMFSRNQNLRVHDLLEMAQGFYTADHITTTERDILEALNWHVNPPTVMDYCDVYLTLFPQHIYGCYGNDAYSPASQWSSSKRVGEKQRRKCRCRCQSMVGIVLHDVFFVDKPNFLTALAAVLLAADAFRGCARDNSFVLEHFLRNIQGVVNIQKEEFDSIIRRLECYC